MSTKVWVLSSSVLKPTVFYSKPTGRDILPLLEAEGYGIALNLKAITEADLDMDISNRKPIILCGYKELTLDVQECVIIQNQTFGDL